MDPVERLLALAAEALSEAGLEFALIGGCARNFYAEPRATRDVDLAVRLDQGGWARVQDAMARRGFTVGSRVGEVGSDPDLAHFRNVSGDRIDLLFAKTSFEEQALARRREGVRVGTTRLPVVTPEDLIVLKLIAGRSQDLVDVEEVAATLAAAGMPIDWRYIEDWCREWDALDRLARVRQSLGQMPDDG